MNPTRRFRELRLFWKLLIPFATLLVIVGAFGAFVMIRDQASRAQSALNRDLQEASLQVRSTLQQRELYLLESANLAANLEGMAAAVTEGDPAASADLLRSVVALKGELDAVAVLDTDGRPLASLGSAGTPSGITFDAGTTFIAAALASEDGNKHAGFVATDASALLAIAAPICSGTDPCAPVGAAVVAQDISGVLEGLAAGDLAARLDGGGLALFEESGRPLAATGTTPEVAADTGPEPDRLVRVVGEIDGSEVHTLYAPYGLQGEVRGTVAVTLSAESAFADLRGTGLRLTLVLLLALVGIVAVGALVSRAILRQVRPLVEANKRLGSGDLTARVPIVSGDEIGEVASGLNQM
ncbi:MAG: HAMP domain-containing protein, partial [Actinobacteria bacterium]|nr:HAMP domain-containing protein [Actinomycetota bacterium]